MTRYNYSRDHSPPAPFVYVTASRPDQPAEQAQWPAQIDTGADRTVVPPELVDALSLGETGEIPVGGLGGRVTLVRIYLVSLAVRDLQPVLVEVAAVPGESHVLLGRDVLNMHRVVLDGPRLVCEID